MSKSAAEKLNNIIDTYSSIREFSRSIGEDYSDVQRWRWGERKINPRAVVSICRLHPEIKPYDLNPYVFPDGLIFKFGKY